MKKIIALSIVAVITLATVSFNASAKNASKSTSKASSEVAADMSLLRDFVNMYEMSLISGGYTITNITSTQIEAVKTMLPRHEIAKIFSSSDKKVKTKKITATFSKTDEGFAVNVEEETEKTPVEEYKSLLGKNFRDAMHLFRAHRG